MLECRVTTFALFFAKLSTLLQKSSLAPTKDSLITLTETQSKWLKLFCESEQRVLHSDWSRLLDKEILDFFSVFPARLVGVECLKARSTSRP